MKKVTIIVPVYNAEKFIDACIASLLNQTYPNIEIILIEDKSSDHSLELLKAYQKDFRVRVLENETNKGIGYSRNRGIDASTGDYIMFVDSDDILCPDALEQLVFALEHGNTDMSMCSYRTFIKQKKSTNETRGSKDFEVIDLEKNNNFLDLLVGGACWAKLFKRSLFDYVRFPEGIFYEDGPVTYPLMIKSNRVAFIDYPFYQYRFNLSGVTKSNKKGPNKNILDLYHATCILDQNYQLVRKNNIMDDKVRQLGYSTLFIGTLDSAFWLQMKKRKEIARGFHDLANKKYHYQSYKENQYLEDRIRSNSMLSIRMKYIDARILNYDSCIQRTETEILTDIKNNLEEYFSNKETSNKVLLK